MSILAVRLEPNYAEGADETEQCTKLKLPLPDHRSFLRKKREGEERGEDNRRANENRIRTRAHIKQRHHLRDLMNDIWQTGDQTKPNRADVDPRASAKFKNNEWDDGETGDGVSVEILRPRIVEAIQIELEQRGQRPDRDRGKDGGISSGKLPRFGLHTGDSGMAAGFGSLICSLAQLESVTTLQNGRRP